MKKEIMFAAYNDKKEIVDIKTVPNGLACKCTCIACGQPLNARNEGKHNIPHFAHVSGFDNPACSETAKHAMAKQIIKEKGWFPFGYRAYKADSIELEKTIGDIRPDVLAVYKGIPVAIEIFVNHAVDDEKLKKVKSYNLTMVEINLSKTLVTSKEDLLREVFNPDNWNLLNIYNRPTPRQIVVSPLLFIPSKRTVIPNKSYILDAVDRREERSYSYRYRKSRFSNRNNTYRYRSYRSR